MISEQVHAEEIWAEASDYANFHVVIPGDATEIELFRAEQFQMYWQRTTGHYVSIGPAPETGLINVWVSRRDNPYAAEIDLSGAGRDGFVVRTFGRAGNTPETRALVFLGDEPRGPLYGIYQFVQDVLDVFWMVEDYHYPFPPDTIPQLSIEYTPPLWYRDIGYHYFTRKNWFTNVVRLNGFWSHAREKAGGYIGYVGDWPGLGHTFHDFVDPDEYFDEHPEYFAKIYGERQKDAQLCLTNPDVLRITIDKARVLLRDRKPHQQILSISQMDYIGSPSWCTCSNCAALDAHEGSPAGSIVHFVNAVADAIKAEFPEVYIDTFAYAYSRKPPRHVRPRDNVIVRFCPIEADYSVPLDDRRSAINRPIAEDLRGWARITKNLFVWEYAVNLSSLQQPHPNYHVFQPNAAYYAKLGVQGVYAQGSWESPHSEFEHLRGMILANAIWNPDVDWQSVRDGLLRLYYEDAAPYVREYLDLITRRVSGPDTPLRPESDLRWLDYGTIVAAQDIFRRAFDATSDVTTLRRLAYAYLPVQYAALVAPPRIELEPGRLVLTRPPSQRFDEYWDMIQRYGVTRLNDWPIDLLRERLDNTTPPRREILPYLKLSGRDLNLWIVPDRSAAVIRVDRARNALREIEGNASLDPDRAVVQAIVREGVDERWRNRTEPLSVTRNEKALLVLETAHESGLREKRRFEQSDSNGIAISQTISNDSGAEAGQAFGLEFGPFVLDRVRAVKRRNAGWGTIDPGNGIRMTLHHPGVCGIALKARGLFGDWLTVEWDAPEAALTTWMGSGWIRIWGGDTAIVPGETRRVELELRGRKPSIDRD